MNTQEIFTKQKALVSFGREPIKIEILTDILGVKFKTCYRNRLILKMDDVEIGFLSLKDLIKNKKATGRPEDLADVARLLKKKKKK